MANEASEQRGTLTLGPSRPVSARPARPLAWSFSALSSFELCPKKFHAEKILRIVKDEGNAMRDYGKEAHAAFEKRLLRNTKLPMDLQHHERNLASLANAPGEGFEEQKLALNQDYQPTGFFDDDVWVRAVIDYAKLNNNHGVIIDHKFGRPSEDFSQLDLMVAVLSVFQPQIDFYTGAFYWAKEKRFATKKYTKEDVPDIWASFLPRVARMEHAKKNDEYPARTNFLCKRHCKVRTCPYNGA